MSYQINVSGFRATMDAMQELPDRVSRATSQAINKTADRTKAEASRRMRGQVNFPAQYLSQDRFSVAQRASPAHLEAKITARFRATSLARFVTRGGSRGTPITVSIHPGSSVVLPRAFFIRLRAGSAELDTKSNLGLAIRTPKPPRVAYKPKQIAPGLWLLYGPSVAQVFQSVREDVEPYAVGFFEGEFDRLMELKK